MLLAGLDIQMRAMPCIQDQIGSGLKKKFSQQCFAECSCLAHLGGQYRAYLSNFVLR